LKIIKIIRNQHKIISLLCSVKLKLFQTTTEITFNDVPNVLKNLSNKFEDFQSALNDVRNSLENAKVDNHVPMNLSEACAFLRMKEKTMYYHLGKKNIPATKSGKNYLFFKDELIKWVESGRVTEAPMSPEELNASIAAKHRRGANPFTF
jgi:excisionase family DNA binding protein